MSSPISLAAVRAELARTLKSTGGRPSIEGTDRRFKIPLRDTQLRALEEIATEVSSPGFTPSFWLDETIEHLAEHGVTPQEFERVVSNPEEIGESRSSNRPCCWGETADGRYRFCVFEKLDEMTILPITAYDSRRPGE